MKSDLFLRTDVLPAEIPVLFSNKSVYLNFHKKFIDKLSKNNTISDIKTIPYNFHIPKNTNESRKISLVHPLAQVQMFQYIVKYERLITSFCKNSPFSVRSPIKRNIPKYIDYEIRAKELKKIEEEFSFVDSFSVTSEEDQILYYNYFSYRNYTRIKNLHNSPKFNRDKYKFNYFMKLDIQRCFPSIYTHSLAWAIFGDKSIAKKHSVKHFNNAFPNATDKIAQIINFNETNGLIVGPEFSRVLAELLFTRVDVDLQIQLRRKGLTNKSDYSIYRFIDDYFFFTDTKENALLIETSLRNELHKYNLNLNIHKSQLQNTPVAITGYEIQKLNLIFKQFHNDKRLSFEKKKENPIYSELQWADYKGSRNQWNFLFNQVESLIINNIESKSKIVKYFLKAIRTDIIYDGQHKHIVASILEIVSNIFMLDISNDSTNYLISIYIKILKKARSIEIKSKVKMEKDPTLESKNEYYHNIENLNYIEEKVFQHAYRIIKNQLINTNQMYDLIIFMKILDKKLPSSLLCKILDMFNDSYFVCCAIGYYILDDKLETFNKSFITVQKKLENIITTRINTYVNKGIEYNLLDAEYFYLLNDFSKYPGFSQRTSKQLSKQLHDEIQQICSQKSEEQLPMNTQLWNSITKFSYFSWTKDMESFVRKIVKKSSNSKLNQSFEY